MPWSRPDLLKIREDRLEVAQRVADEGGTFGDCARALGVSPPALYDSVYMWRPELREQFEKNFEQRKDDKKKDRIILIALACLDVIQFQEVAQIEGVSHPAIVQFRDKHCGWKPLEWLAERYGPELPARIVRIARRHQRPPVKDGRSYPMAQNPHYFEPWPGEDTVPPVELPVYIDGTSESQPVQNFD